MDVSSAMASSKEPLFGPTSQNLELGLMSARTAAVLRRIVDDNLPDDIDRVVLREAAEIMNATADAAEVVAAGGRLQRDRGTLGFGAMAFAVESASPQIPAAEVPRFLRNLANALSQLGGNPEPTVAASTLPAFSTLADLAMRKSGSVGEGNGSPF